MRVGPVEVLAWLVMVSVAWLVMGVMGWGRGGEEVMSAA